jgi:hypothetical protein
VTEGRISHTQQGTWRREGGSDVTDLLVIMLWQVVLFGGWSILRRLRAVERRPGPPCYGQVGALREQIVELRADQAFDGEEQARRLHGLEMSSRRAEADVRELIRQYEEASTSLFAEIARLERSLGVPIGPDTPRPDEHDERNEHREQRRAS